MPYSIITDFSKTLTRSNGKTSWSLFMETGILGEEYNRKREQLFQKYAAHEIDGDIAKVSEWFIRHCDLLNEYGALDSISQLVKISRERGILIPRDGFKEFFEWCSHPLIVTEVQIVSSGITELIEEFFLQEQSKTPLHRWILANNLQYISGAHIEAITPLNKQDQLVSKGHLSTALKAGEIVVVLGDSPEDFPKELTFTSEGPYRGFSFTDTEIIPGVVALGKEGSLERIINALK